MQGEDTGRWRWVMNEDEMSAEKMSDVWEGAIHPEIW